MVVLRMDKDNYVENEGPRQAPMSHEYKGNSLLNRNTGSECASLMSGTNTAWGSLWSKHSLTASDFLNAFIREGSRKGSSVT